MQKIIFILTAIFIITGDVSAKSSKEPGANIQADNYYPLVKIETSIGDFIIELNRKRAPATVNSFLSYVVRKEYDGTIFHRVIPNYIAQGGGYETGFKERKTSRTIINESGNGLKNDMYSISMAREDDPHSATRQFFFNLKDNDNLNPGKGWGYTVFGYVTDGTEVIDAFSEIETEYKATIRFQDTPKEDVILIKATVLPLDH
ncbi:peptidylprolyl isomerase [Glaciecola sp. MH2013]|uniref:peptidylprolyl isomerase n=1 Tax=Glaciecola sp. MH2013 TaxID=2785524 RepID=UPI00189E1EE5|nr:peptidylprolyl isomerase [Glaciecola sp. MH2013]MBF7071895.1 peptidylprolyl isomerase [Glaciecola sp. MH2013]